MTSRFVQTDGPLKRIGWIEIYETPDGQVVPLASLVSHDSKRYLRVTETNGVVTVTVERRTLNG